MPNRFPAVFVLVVSVLIALIGIFMAARAEDGLFAFHGWVLVIFGVLMCFAMAARFVDHDQS
jgi:hypothetical protein